MKVRILYFSSIKDKIKKQNEEIEITEETTIKELKEKLIEKYPEAEGIINKSMFAVNEEYVSDTYKLKEGDLVAVIPPVSGG